MRASLRVLVLLVLLVLLAPGAPVPARAQGDAAPATRASAIAAEQTRKALQVVPETRGVAEETVLRILSSPLLTGSGGLYPWFGSVFGGSGYSMGAGYLRRLPRDARVDAVAGVSINGSTLIEATLAAPALLGGWVRPRLVARRIEANDVAFFGVGPDSTEVDQAGYAFSPTTLGTALAVRPLRHLELTGGYEWLAVDSDVEDALWPGFVPADAPGLGQEIAYDVLRAVVAVDTRPSPGYATRGTLARVAYGRHAARSDDPFGFDEVELEAVHLVPLLREQYVLAFRGLATFTSPDAGQAVPVTLMPFLGSGSTLRGFTNRRFYDTNRLVATAEYRWRPSRYLDMAVFLDAGQVAPARQAFRLSDLETNVGLGARFHGPSFSAFRVELARSREHWNLVFAGSQAF